MAAVGKSTLQSSTWIGAEAELAVDGILNPDMLWAHSCSHTLQEVQPWWAVDLAYGYIITAVIVLNRGDCCCKHNDNDFGLDILKRFSSVTEMWRHSVSRFFLTLPLMCWIRWETEQLQNPAGHKWHSDWCTPKPEQQDLHGDTL